MDEPFRIHFGTSKRSKFYPQALELARLAKEHEILGEGEDTWHVVTFADDQASLMASLYPLAVKLPGRRIYGADIVYVCVYCRSGGTYDYAHASAAFKVRVRAAVERLQRDTGYSLDELADYLHDTYLRPASKDMRRVAEKLKAESRIDYIDERSGRWVRARNKPSEPLVPYDKIKALVSNKDYAAALDLYYAHLGTRHCGELTPELIYLKRLAGAELTGRDLLYFKPDSSRANLPTSDLDQYVRCIDDILSRLADSGRKSPMQLILENAPTMPQLIAQREAEWHLGAYLRHGKLNRDSTPVTLESFSAQFDYCPEGRIFERYPDQIRHSCTYEPQPDPRFIALWTPFSPSFYRDHVLAKGLHVNMIEGYRHKNWRPRRGRWRREPPFTSVTSIEQIQGADYAIKSLEYTGRSHTVEGRAYFEVNLVHRFEARKEIANPTLELIDEVLREAENLLRESLGLPRIGEGWMEEMKLFRLVQALFPDAEHHASPTWLRPQHLDVYVPSQALAFEYHGLQHFEPVDFFGGEDAFHQTVERDRRKVERCLANHVRLLTWPHNEPIDPHLLSSKLAQLPHRQ